MLQKKLETYKQEGTKKENEIENLISCNKEKFEN
jgi:hypothetical protein